MRTPRIIGMRRAQQRFVEHRLERRLERSRRGTASLLRSSPPVSSTLMLADDRRALRRRLMKMLIHLCEEIVERKAMSRRTIVFVRGKVTQLAYVHLVRQRPSGKQIREAKLLAGLACQLLQRGTIIHWARTLASLVNEPEAFTVSRVAERRCRRTAGFRLRGTRRGRRAPPSRGRTRRARPRPRLVRLSVRLSPVARRPTRGSIARPPPKQPSTIVSEHSRETRIDVRIRPPGGASVAQLSQPPSCARH